MVGNTTSNNDTTNPIEAWRAAEERKVVISGEQWDLFITIGLLFINAMVGVAVACMILYSRVSDSETKRSAVHADIA